MYKFFKVFAFLSQMIEFVTIGIFAKNHVITQNPVTGRMSGNIANTRFGTWRGINIAASIGLKSQRKPQKESTAVLLNRAKMKLCGHTMIASVPWVKLFYPNTLIGTTPFAQLLKYFRNKITGTISTLLLDVSQIIGTYVGNGYSFFNTYTNTNAALAAFTMTWSNLTGDLNFSPAAELYFIFFNDDFTKLKMYNYAGNLGTGAALLDLSDTFVAGDKVKFFTAITENDAYTMFIQKTSKALIDDSATFITLI